jgi:hypothetical protein
MTMAKVGKILVVWHSSCDSMIRRRTEEKYEERKIEMIDGLIDAARRAYDITKACSSQSWSVVSSRELLRSSGSTWRK